MANVPISAFTVGANTTGIGASGYSLTGSAANSYIDLAGTWNTSGTPTAIKLNITDTASNASSLLMDLQVGGSTKFSVIKDGSLLVTGSSTSNIAQIRSPVYANTGIRWDGGGYVLTFLAAGVAIKVDQNQNIILDDPRFKFGWSAGSGGGLDTVLNRDAADTLAQRRTTNAQTFRVYKTFTDSSNYERIAVSAEASRFVIEVQNAGTGSGRDLRLQTTTANPMEFGTSNVVRWSVSTAGHFLAFADNTYDIGATGATRPRNVFVAGYHEMTEMTAPAAPAANSVRIYAQDNGAGKTQLMALFATGVAQQIAIEP